MPSLLLGQFFWGSLKGFIPQTTLTFALRSFKAVLLSLLTRSVHCFTLSRGRRAESDFGQQRRNKPNFIRELVPEAA